MDSQSKLKDYMSQMRVMEDKLRETKLQAKFDEYSQLSYDEFEKEEKLRREEDELRHLRELQEEERRRREAVQAQYARMQYAQPYGAPVPYNYAAELARQKQAIEMQQLAILQEQVRVQEEENRRLQERLNSMQVRPVYQYPMPSPYPQPQPSPYPPQPPVIPQQPPVMMMSPPVQYPTQVYFIQNNEPSSKAKTNEPLSKESETASDKRDMQSDRVEKVDAVVEEKKEAVVEVDHNVERNIGDEFDDDSDIKFNERLSFADLYVLLSSEQKRYCDELRDYAKKKSGAKEFPAKYHLAVGNGQKVIVKMTIKNGICFAQFRLEDERLRSIRRNASMGGADIQIKETKVPLLDESALIAAKEMVDLRLVQLEEHVLLQKQRAAERRKAAKPD